MTNERNNFIGGRWTAGGPLFERRNPSDLSDTLGTFTEATEEQAVEAVAAAKKALPAWSNSHMRERERLLKSISAALSAKADELGALLSREEGKPLREGVGTRRSSFGPREQGSYARDFYTETRIAYVAA